MTESNNDKDDIKEWMKKKIEYLPGDTWPESWIIQKCSEKIDELANNIGADKNQMAETVERGLEAGKHNEFHEIAKLVGLGKQATIDRFCLTVSQNHSEMFQDLISSLEQRLSNAE